MKTLLSVNVTSIIHFEEWSGSVGKTGIDKRPKLGRVALENDGVEGDSVLDTKNHGGKDQAVYARYFWRRMCYSHRYCHASSW